RRTNPGDFDTLGNTEKFKDLDRDPGDVEFIPRQTVTGGGWMRVVVIMPALAKREESDPPVVARIVTRGKAPRTPHVGDRIDRPRAVQSRDNPQTPAP